MRKSIRQTLMERDGLTAEEADHQVQALQESFNERIAEGDLAGAEEVMDEVGLEPDYLDELY